MIYNINIVFLEDHSMISPNKMVTIKSDDLTLTLECKELRSVISNYLYLNIGDKKFKLSGDQPELAENIANGFMERNYTLYLKYKQLPVPVINLSDTNLSDILVSNLLPFVDPSIKDFTDRVREACKLAKKLRRIAIYEDKE